MAGILSRYTKWLHAQWPAGTVEKLPVSNPDGTTALPGVRIVGDLTGIPLLKFSSHTGAEAVREILKEQGGRGRRKSEDWILPSLGRGWREFRRRLRRRKRG
jgi:hypothetical protein